MIVRSLPDNKMVRKDSERAAAQLRIPNSSSTHMSDHSETTPPTTRQWQIGPSCFQACPEKGARLMSWDIATPATKRQVIYWPESPEGPFAKIRGGNPVLFPFAARSYDQGMENHWRSPDGKRRPMPRHGFARDGEFELESLTENGFTARLLPKPEDAEAYPFDYTFRVAYQFDELGFRVTFRLQNSGDTPIPWSAGHHFYFTCPWHPAARRQDYHLQMNCRKAAYPTPAGKLVSERIADSCHSLGDPSLIERIHWQIRQNRIAFGPRSGEEDTHIILADEPIPPPNLAVVTWTESEDAPFYCIEPWMGPPNAAEHGKGLNWVNPGEESAWPIEVSLY